MKRFAKHSLTVYDAAYLEHALLKDHDVYLNFAPDHAQQELAAANQLHAERFASATSVR